MLLSIENLYFQYSENKPLFQNFNLKIEEGKIIALAGESGCGKSTLLNLIYGLLDWDRGEIFLDGIKLLGPKGNIVPGEEKIKLVAQNYDLMLYATVAENIGKFISNINLEEKKERISELLEVVGLQEFAQVKPKYLSGGQQQRVAIARALSVMPKFILLDEPFSNIDFSRKLELREKLFTYVKEKNISVIISTHEIQEVMPWLDRIVVLKDGRLIQNSSPIETYKEPYNHYVAELFGEVNILSKEEKQLLNSKKDFYYPQEIIIVENGIPAEIIESRFSGSFYWNKILVKDIVLIFYSDKELNNKKINISFL